MAVVYLTGFFMTWLIFMPFTSLLIADLMNEEQYDMPGDSITRALWWPIAVPFRTIRLLYAFLLFAVELARYSSIFKGQSQHQISRRLLYAVSLYDSNSDIVYTDVPGELTSHIPDPHETLDSFKKEVDLSPKNSAIC